LAEYAEAARPAILANGGTFLARGGRAQGFGGGISERTVVVEFSSFDQALAAYKSDAYQAAAAKLDGAVERDFRVIEGVE
jgi:uncharacterized protein (DUF1330 family)